MNVKQEFLRTFRDAILFNNLVSDKAVKFQQMLNKIQGTAVSEPNSNEYNEFYENLSTEDVKVKETIITELLLSRYNYPLTYTLSFRSNMPFKKDGENYWIGFDGVIRNTPVYTKSIKDLSDLCFNEKLFILLTH